MNLSTIFYELETIAHDAGLHANDSNQFLIHTIQAATEVLSAMDKVSSASLAVVHHQCSNKTVSLYGHFQQLLTHKSHLIDFFALISKDQLYYSNTDLLTNLEAGAIMNIAHTEMEIELHREDMEAILLRDYIKGGQEIYKESGEDYENLVAYLHRILIDGRIAESFRHIYLDKIIAEQQFASKLTEICQHINLKLYHLGVC